jgi:hypothetical protein
VRKRLLSNRQSVSAAGWGLISELAGFRVL